MSDWYEKWFSSKFYLKLYAHRDEQDAKFIIDLILRTTKKPTNLKVLDVCCGAGRHSLELAKRGYDVTGIDLSEYLIETADKNLKQIKDKNIKIKYLIRDMRCFDFKKQFDMAINIFTSFGYFDNDKENFVLFRNVCKSLKKGGIFIFDFLNSDYIKKNLVRKSVQKSGNLSITQRRKICGNSILKDIEISYSPTYKNNNAKLNKKYNYTEIIKLYSDIILTKVIAEHGFVVRKKFGDYHGNIFDRNKSKRFIVFAEKV